MTSLADLRTSKPKRNTCAFCSDPSAAYFRAQVLEKAPPGGHNSAGQITGRQITLCDSHAVGIWETVVRLMDGEAI